MFANGFGEIPFAVCCDGADNDVRPRRILAGRIQRRFVHHLDIAARADGPILLLADVRRKSVARPAAAKTKE